jgi:hypothetical protein
LFSGGEEESEDHTEEEEDDAVISEDDDAADSDDDQDDDGTQSGDESGEEGAPLAQKRSSFFLGGEESAGEESSGHEDELPEEPGNRTSRKANINVFKIFHCCIQCSGSRCVFLGHPDPPMGKQKKLKNTVIPKVSRLYNNLLSLNKKCTLGG